MQPHKYLNLPIQSSIMITDFTTLISHYITSIIVIKGNIIGIFEWKPLIDLEVFVVPAINYLHIVAEMFSIVFGRTYLWILYRY